MLLIPTVFYTLWPSLACSFGLQALFALLFLPRGTDRWFDLCGSLGFLSTVGVSLLSTWLLGMKPLLTFHPRQLLMSAMTAVWAIRLGAYLFARGQGTEPRMEVRKVKKSTFFAAWMLQAAWIFLTGLPVFLVNSNAPSVMPPLGRFDLVGIVVWSIGFLLEAIADYQKAAWHRGLSHKRHDEEFIHSGLWRLSRHPNYFGEVVLHLGLFIMAIGSFRGSKELSQCTALIAAIGPIFEYLMIRFVTGVPPLEKRRDQKLGSRPEWQSYKQQVPVFFPRVCRFF